jgi:hypothetical protein
LQVTMFLMGCYGYAYNDRHTQNITQLLELPVWKIWSTPFLLQVLETKYASSYSATHARDRSACTCMKDFASPTLVNLKNTADLLDLEPKTSIMDACTVQRTIDYALDGASANAVSGATGQAKSVMLYKPAEQANNPRQRQQQDHLYTAIAAFSSSLGANTAAEQAAFVVSKNHFVEQYCNIVGNVTNSVGQTDCASLTLAAKDATHTAFFTWLQNAVDKVKPHNKLRPPQLCSANNAKEPCPADANQDTPYLSTAGYAKYIEKYLEAFKMCSREGTPRYSTMRLGYLEPHKIYNAGQ